MGKIKCIAVSYMSSILPTYRSKLFHCSPNPSAQCCKLNFPSASSKRAGFLSLKHCSKIKLLILLFLVCWLDVLAFFERDDLQFFSIKKQKIKREKQVLNARNYLTVH